MDDGDEDEEGVCLYQSFIHSLIHSFIHSYATAIAVKSSSQEDVFSPAWHFYK